jgi:peptidoglycan/LPS O-acetylase OafA/YrhL
LQAHKEIYYPYFDYCRAVAALGVFVAHADSHNYFPSNLGNASVQLFFAMSGFLIGGILLRSKRDDLPRFYFNRASRIWIPYAIAILILLGGTLLKQGWSEPKFGEFFMYMATFVYNWFGPPQLAEFKSSMPLDGTGNHFWSICVEEQFYLVAPFMILFFHRFVLLIGLAAATFLSPDYFASISLGVVLAIFGPQTWLITGAAIGGGVAALTGPYIVAAALISAAIVGVLARLPGRQTLVGKIAGGASYPFYLNHWIGLFAINAALRLTLPYWSAWTFGLVVAISISVVHYFAIDRMIAKFRSGWFSKRTGILACGTGFLLVAAGLTYGVWKL